MTLRIAVLGCLLAASGQSQDPVTMHNDPTTFFNGSNQGGLRSSGSGVSASGFHGNIQAFFRSATFVTQANVSGLVTVARQNPGPPGFPANFFPAEKGFTLLEHGHPDPKPGPNSPGQIVLVLRPSATSGILEMVKEIQFHDGDTLHVSLNPSGQIVFRKGSIPGAAAKIPKHASTPKEFDLCVEALNAPMRAAGRASDSSSGGLKATHVNWKSSGNTVPLGAKLILEAAVTSPGGTVPTAQTTLLDNGLNPIVSTLQKGGKARFPVTLTAAGDHCFAVAYPITANFAASKSAEICFRVLPLGCPVMSVDELHAQQDHALAVANTVWGIVGDRTWNVDPDNNGLTVVKYPISTSFMSTVWLDTDPSKKTPINSNCGVVHFCHMKDVADRDGNWTLQPDCGPVNFTCNNKLYTWTPPSNLSQQTTTPDHVAH